MGGLGRLKSSSLEILNDKLNEHLSEIDPALERTLGYMISPRSF